MSLVIAIACYGLLLGLLLLGVLRLYLRDRRRLRGVWRWQEFGDMGDFRSWREEWTWYP